MLSEDFVIARLHLSFYRLALRQPWHTAAGSIAAREGYLVCLRTQEGLVGYGDCAPLALAGTETMRQSGRSLQETCSYAPGRTLFSLLEYLAGIPDRPATCNAVETAVLDVLSQAGEVPLHRYLSQDSGSLVGVNASAGAVGGDTLQRCFQAVAAGYRVIKLKMGMDKIDKEIKCIKNIFNNISENVSLRIDANRSWSTDDAVYVVSALRDFPVECFEEPLREPSREGLRQVQDATRWPIAIDESLSLWSRAELISDPPVRRVVCKPAVLGGLRETLEFARSLQRGGTEVAITTALESAAGTRACMHVAAALNTPVAHGLATSGWFAVNTGTLPEIQAGRIEMPATPGLGFIPHDGRMAPGA